MIEVDDSPQVLYRMFDTAGVLLYVGITFRPETRFYAHEQGKSWWHEVAEITLEHFAGRATVEEAERVAIRTERPKYNVIYALQVAAPKPPPVKTVPRPRVSLESLKVELSVDLLRDIEAQAKRYNVPTRDAANMLLFEGLALESEARQRDRGE